MPAYLSLFTEVRKMLKRDKEMLKNKSFINDLENKSFINDLEVLEIRELVEVSGGNCYYVDPADSCNYSYTCSDGTYVADYRC